MKCLARSAGEFTHLVDCPLKTFLVVTSISADCDGMRCVERQRVPEYVAEPVTDPLTW
jgi:hypothetical protein